MAAKKVVFVIVLSLILLLSTSVMAQKVLKVGEVKANPGEKASGFIVVPAGDDAEKHKIPVTVINGDKAGPVLALIAGVHGYEYPPVLALQRLGKKLKAEGLAGAVIIVHVANVPSFLIRTIYYNPYDMKNMNRVFPGKKDGTVTERAAFQITKEVIDQCDYLIDNHCGDGNEDLIPYLYCTATGDAELDKKTRGLADNFGLKVIVDETGRTKDKNNSIYCGNTALTRGKPAITTESGRLGRSDEKDVIRLLHGTFNILKHLKMIKGEVKLAFEAVRVQEYTIVRSEHDGLFTPLVPGGRHVQKGELVGYLTDYFGNTIQKVHAPHTGIVLYIIATPPMRKGEPMVSVGRF